MRSASNPHAAFFVGDGMCLAGEPRGDGVLSAPAPNHAADLKDDDVEMEAVPEHPNSNNADLPPNSPRLFMPLRSGHPNANKHGSAPLQKFASRHSRIGAMHQANATWLGCDSRSLIATGGRSVHGSGLPLRRRQ